MKIAITGGTGFVGSHLAAVLAAKGHHAVLVARGRAEAPMARILAATSGLDSACTPASPSGSRERDAESADRGDSKADRDHPGREGGRLEDRQVSFVAADVADEEAVARAFEGCSGVAHCAGINREIGLQTYERAHVEGTRRVVAAARRAGVRKIALVSFLRARPDCGSPYHESKWAAEEIVRTSGLDFTVIKPGVIYGRGDHMLDHLSHAFHTFPVFALVGMRERGMRPVAVDDVARILSTSLTEGRLSRQTVFVLGPEELSLGQAVRRVAGVVGKRPLFVRMPILFHRAAAWIFEATMHVPLISRAQVRILSEGLTGPAPPCSELPVDLLPRTGFSEQQIQAGLPEPARFGLRDCRWLAQRG